MSRNSAIMVRCQYCNSCNVKPCDNTETEVVYYCSNCQAPFALRDDEFALTESYKERPPTGTGAATGYKARKQLELQGWLRLIRSGPALANILKGDLKNE